MLEDPAIVVATSEIVAGSKSRSVIDREIKAKESAVSQLSRRYQNSNITRDEVQQCLYSIGDNDSALIEMHIPTLI